MYDSETVKFIRNAPQLSDLDVGNLPELLAKIYAELVSIRVQLREGEFDSKSLKTKISYVNRLAQTYETLVLINPERSNRNAAAFVSATAYQLVYQANKLLKNSDINTYLDESSISVNISAMLLFLISGYFSDAKDVADTINVPKISGQKLQNEVILNLIYLARGEIYKITDRDEFQLDYSLSESYANHAVNALYHLLLRGIRVLALNLSSNYDEKWEDSLYIFSKVKDMSSPDEVIEIGEGRNSKVIGFSGPYHLACLLEVIGKTSMEYALNRVNPPDGVSSQKWNAILNSIAETRPFLWQNHLDAVQSGYLNKGISTVVNFPTGAGKSIVSQLKIISTLLVDEKVVILAPTRALVDQIANDIRKLQIDFPVIASTDSNVYIHNNIEEYKACVLVMTPESCLQQMLIKPEYIKNFGLLVFDECHNINPKSQFDKRPIDAMLCILNFMRNSPVADIMMISAMIANDDELKSWLEFLTDRPALTLNSDWKPTRQLRGCIVYDEKIRKNVSDTSTPSEANPYAFFSVKQLWNSTEYKKDYSLVKISNENIKLELNTKGYNVKTNSNTLATIIAVEAFFAKIRTLVVVQKVDHTRSIMEKINKKVGNAKIYLNKTEEKLLNIALEELGGSKYLYLKFYEDDILDGNIIIESYASVHHGLLLPQERQLVERLYKKPNGLRVLVCTSTLSEGMNLPAELVVIAQMYRFSSAKNKDDNLGPEELLNAAGRAGRAGESSSGIVIAIPKYAVGFKDKQIVESNDWKKFKGIFCQSDKCIILDDPLTKIMDQIHSQSIEDEDLSRYSISRLVDIKQIDNDDQIQNEIFNRSFAAYLKHNSGDVDWVNSRLNSAIELLKSNKVENLEEIDFIRNMSAMLGTPEDIIENIMQNMNLEKEYKFKQIYKTIEWMFDWFKNNSEAFYRLLNKKNVEDLFGSEYKKLNDNIERVKFAVPVLMNSLKLWMEGKSLGELQTEIFDAQKSEKYCLGARKFVIRVLPFVAHSIIIAPSILYHYGQINDSEKKISSARLHYMYRCLIDGYSSIEMSILATQKKYIHLSRKKLHVEFGKIEAFLTEPEENETITDIKNRVKHAILMSTAI